MGAAGSRSKMIKKAMRSVVILKIGLKNGIVILSVYKKKNLGGHNTMKTFILSLILFLLTAGIGFSSRLGTLPQVMKPVSADVDEDNLYVMEASTVSVYSLKDLRLICKFAKEGEGPGELKSTPFYINRMVILQENVMLEGLDKIIKEKLK
jgi:hypothetical protein